MLNNFVHERTLFSHSVSVRALSNRCNVRAFYHLFHRVKMANVDESYHSSSSEDEEILLYLLLLRRRRRCIRAANRKTFVKSWVSRRQALEA